MPQGIQALAARQLLEQERNSEQRLVDMRVQWLEWGDSNEIILDVGGRWDRRLERWDSEGTTAQAIRFQPAQYKSAYWFAGWLAAYLKGGQRPPEYDRVWTMLNVGGRRGGKSDFAVKAIQAFAVAKPGRICWAISPTEDETIELQDVFDRVMPPEWCHFSETKLVYTLAHMSKIELRSGYKPSSLKRGRVDLWLMNEGQLMPEKAYAILRAPIADTGGLGMITANPPDTPIGHWVMDHYDGAKAGRFTERLFEFDPRQNPAIDFQALADMKEDIDEKSFRREVLGEFIEIGDLVFYAWSPRENTRPAPDVGDCTSEFLKQHLGRPFEHVLGVDLQLSPHNASVEMRFFHDPDRPGDPLSWIVDEVIVEGTEDDLCDAWLDRGYDPATTALIIDASAWWQDDERTKGRGSVDIFRKRGFRFCYRPDRKAKRNPIIIERCQATNAKMKSAAGRRALFCVPECVQTNRAIRRWENKNGAPHRKSEFAHISDAFSYIVWRFFPRKRAKTAVGYEKIKRSRTRRERDLDIF